MREDFEDVNVNFKFRTSQLERPLWCRNELEFNFAWLRTQSLLSKAVTRSSTNIFRSSTGSDLMSFSKASAVLFSRSFLFWVAVVCFIRYHLNVGKIYWKYLTDLRFENMNSEFYSTFSFLNWRKISDLNALFMEIFQKWVALDSCTEIKCHKKKRKVSCTSLHLDFIFAYCLPEAFAAAFAKGNCQFCPFSCFIWSSSHFPGFLRLNFFSTLRTFGHILISLVTNVEFTFRRSRIKGLRK